jgi:hypothetical protein
MTPTAARTGAPERAAPRSTFRRPASPAGTLPTAAGPPWPR